MKHVIFVAVIASACTWSGAMAQDWERDPYKPVPPPRMIVVPDQPDKPQPPRMIIIPDQRLCEGPDSGRHPVLVDSKPIFRDGRQIFFDFDSDREYHCTIGRRPVYDSPELSADADPSNGGWFS